MRKKIKVIKLNTLYTLQTNHVVFSVAVLPEPNSVTWLLHCEKPIRCNAADLSAHPPVCVADYLPEAIRPSTNQLSSDGIKLGIVYSGNPPEIWWV